MPHAVCFDSLPVIFNRVPSFHVKQLSTLHPESSVKTAMYSCSPELITPFIKASRNRQHFCHTHSGLSSLGVRWDAPPWVVSSPSSLSTRKQCPTSGSGCMAASGHRNEGRRRYQLSTGREDLESVACTRRAHQKTRRTFISALEALRITWRKSRLPK